MTTLLKNIGKNSRVKMNNNPKMYLILREDLAFKYIQGGHALAQFALEHDKEFKDWNNQYLICLSVFNGLALRNKMNELGKLGIPFSQFVEPDLETQLPTALTVFEDGSGFVSNALKDIGLATK